MWQITDVLFNIAMIIVCPYLIIKTIAKTIAVITIINQYTHTEYSKASVSLATGFNQYERW